MSKEHLVAVNIPADGLFLAIWNKADGDLSRENCTRLIRAYIDRYLAEKPDTIFLNVNYRRALTPSRVMDSYLYNIETDENGDPLLDENGNTVKTLSPKPENVSKYFDVFGTCARPLLEKGIDIYDIITRQIRDAGCKVFLSVRMNDGHFRDDPAINSHFAMKNGGVHTIAQDGADLDFSQPAVQNHICGYIEELLQTYKADGIELDWLRFPTVLPPEKRNDYAILNGYMARIRSLLNRYDPGMSLAVRVYAPEEKNLAQGMDVCRWIAEGSADVLTIENFYVPTNFEMPVTQWRENIAKHNGENRPYTLLCGSDWAVACRPGYHLPMNPALVRGFTGECLARGADGVYLFNFFEEDAFSSYELTKDGTLQSCFRERLGAAREYSRFPRRCVHIGATTRRYPIVLQAGEEYTCAWKTQKPCHTLRLVMGFDKPFAGSLTVNGQKADLQAQPMTPGFAFGGGVRGGEFIHAVTEIAPVVMSARVPVADTIEVSFTNEEEPVNLWWLELEYEA